MRRYTLIGVVCWLLSVAPARADSPSENSAFLGVWHLLVHDQDRTAAVPERWHWEDRIWVIESEGAALRWRDYPIVIFRDESGRFEKNRGGLQRIAHAWEPNEKQAREIRSGLQVNDRGARSKRLEAVVTSAAKPAPTGNAVAAAAPTPSPAPHEGHPAAAPSQAQPPAPGSASETSPAAPDAVLAAALVRWASAAGPAASSALVITYTEHWSIRENPANGLPIFVWDAALESGLGEGVEGSTLWIVEEKSADGSEYRGRYQKDGHIVGRFRMQRSGPISQLGG